MKNNLTSQAQQAIVNAQHGDFEALGTMYPASGITQELLQNGYIELVSKQPIYGSNELQLILATYRLTAKGQAYKQQLFI